MILGIYGASATGKTTAAKILSIRLELPVRHCGDAVRLAAAEAGTHVDLAGLALHRLVDAATLQWCDSIAETGGIVDGRFLDSVLRGRQDAIFVGLYAQKIERARRMSARAECMISVDDVSAIDAEDEAFRFSMYGAARENGSVIVDTTGELIDSWVKNLEQDLIRYNAAQRG